MSAVGLCTVCSNPANRTCEGCGSPVCDDHYDAETRLCDDCLGGRRLGSE
ncbi:MAG: hypothetical protein SV760_03675 [Halobacteria archaeon]|nr:hypothetical protein [Halobacteria archaeon]